MTTLTCDKGWVTEASVEDVKLLPGVHRTMFELQGGEWVAREVAQECQERAGKVRSPYRGPGLVGDAGLHALRQSILAAGERGRIEAVTGPG